MKKIIFITIAIVFNFCVLFSQSQTSSRNGAWITQSGEFNVFLVFVHLDNHPEPWHTNSSIWQPNQLPTDADLYFDAVYNPNQQTGLMTKYMHQASFGQFHLTGDYYTDLVTIDYNDLIDKSSGYFMGQVVKNLNDNNPTDIITANGQSISNNDFDLWQKKSTAYTPSILGSDNEIDYLIVVIDNGLPSFGNVTTIDNCGEGGHFGPSVPNNQILSKNIEGNFLMAGCDGIEHGFTLLKHEFNHSLFGGNVPYHTAT